MRKFQQVLANHRTKELIEYEYIMKQSIPENEIDKSFREVQIYVLETKLLTQARKVIAGRCPHEGDYLSSNLRTVNPRNWISYTERSPVYGPCKFCGEKF